jgi:hypothetical protein
MMRTFTKSRNRKRPAVIGSRSGAALLLVIIAIVVSSMVTATLAQMAIAQHRQMRHEQNRVQAFWLAESGLNRAAMKLNADPQYVGEEWRVPVTAEETQTALVTIRVLPERIEIAAEYPVDTVYRAQVRRELPRPVTVTEQSPRSAISPENVVP